MATKRAMVAAVLAATAASDIFTQDVEDIPIQAEPKQKEDIPLDRVTDGQRKRLYAIYKGAGKSDAEVKEYIKSKFGIESSKDITKDIYQEICDWAGNKVYGSLEEAIADEDSAA